MSRLRAAASRIDLRAGMEFSFPVGRSATLSRMVQNTNLLKGGNALASPKGDRPCPLGTLDHTFAGHLVFR